MASLSTLALVDNLIERSDLPFHVGNMAENSGSNGSPQAQRNIALGSLKEFPWNSEDPKNSIEALFAYVESEADKAMDWYWQKKKSKALASRMIQFCAIVLTAAGAILPVLVNILKTFFALPDKLDTGLMTSLLVGLAAALIGIDRAFGYSSGWARYVVTATSMRKSLEQFRMDWTALCAKGSVPPTPEQLTALVGRATEFAVGIQSMVLQETKDWVTEFQNSLSQLDKEARDQLDTLRAKVEQATAETAVDHTGSVELTVANAGKTDGFSFAVVLEDSREKVKEASVANDKKWVCIGLVPGQYKATVTATVHGKEVRTAGVITIKPQEVTATEISLPA